MNLVVEVATKRKTMKVPWVNCFRSSRECLVKAAEEKVAPGGKQTRNLRGIAITVGVMDIG